MGYMDGDPLASPQARQLLGLTTDINRLEVELIDTRKALDAAKLEIAVRDEALRNCEQLLESARDLLERYGDLLSGLGELGEQTG